MKLDEAGAVCAVRGTIALSRISSGAACMQAMDRIRWRLCSEHFVVAEAADGTTARTNPTLPAIHHPPAAVALRRWLGIRRASSAPASPASSHRATAGLGICESQQVSAVEAAWQAGEADGGEGGLALSMGNLRRKPFVPCCSLRDRTCMDRSPMTVATHGGSDEVIARFRSAHCWPC